MTNTLSNKTEFKREERYIVIKRKHLHPITEASLRNTLNELGVGTVECVVVESDWPEYETVWRMIEERAAGRTTQCSGDTQELADPQVVVAGKLLTIKPGAPEIALLCRAIFRASFADDEDEALVNQKYQEWEEDQAKAIRAARFVLRALGGNGSVVRALRTTHSPSEAGAAVNAIAKIEMDREGYPLSRSQEEIEALAKLDSHLGEMK